MDRVGALVGLIAIRKDKVNFCGVNPIAEKSKSMSRSLNNCSVRFRDRVRVHTAKFRQPVIGKNEGPFLGFT